MNVSPYVDYCIKYSNDLEPLKATEEVDVIMFKVLPGRSRHIAVTTPGMKPTDVTCAVASWC